LTFKTSGQGNIYKIGIERSPINEQTYWNWRPDYINIENIGGSFNFSSEYLSHLYPCDVTINLNNVLIFPLRVTHYTTYYDESYEIQNNATTTKRIYIENDAPQTVYIYRTNKGSIEKATYNFPISSSTTTQSIEVNETDFVKI